MFFRAPGRLIPVAELGALGVSERLCDFAFRVFRGQNSGRSVRELSGFTTEAAAWQISAFASDPTRRGEYAVYLVSGCFEFYAQRTPNHALQRTGLRCLTSCLRFHQAATARSLSLGR